MFRFDIAFRSSDEHFESSRADFLTQSDFNCKDGYRALVQDQIPRQSLVQDALWHYSLTPILSKLGLEIAKDLQSLVNQFRQYDLVSEAAASSTISSDSSEQLVLDLALSTDVLSPQRCVHPTKDGLDALETMSRATETMSLAAEPPPVHLGYLTPKHTDVSDTRSSPQLRTASSNSQELDSPLGVQLLLKEWEVGADPRRYTYEDPYSDSYGSVVPKRHSKDKGSSKETIQVTMPGQSRRPPVIITSKALVPPVTTLSALPPHERHSTQPQVSAKRDLFRTGSRMTPNDPGIGTSSQDFMTSTQILPGPHGGRQPIRRKPTKKRLGGF